MRGNEKLKDKPEKADIFLSVRMRACLRTCVSMYQNSTWMKQMVSKKLAELLVIRRGQTQAEVAKAIGVSQSVISRIWNRFLETESAGRRPGQGRRRETTPNEDRFFSVNGSETPKYERYSSQTTPSLGY
ncbi:hypothetical protein TNCV_2111191 [Trichonephila clavipes]|nr:hypothetical protein TNCV_2111191 [Trichonephila clavipes]